MRETQFADTSLEAIRSLVGEQNVRYVKGYFTDSASEMPADLRFALVHIDCDLYLSVSHALRYADFLAASMVSTLEPSRRLLGRMELPHQ